MPTLLRATADDAPIITAHRHLMFADNELATEARLSELDAAFEPWVRQRIADGRYVGLFLVEDLPPEPSQPAETGEMPSGTEIRILSACGIFFGDFPPHYLDTAPVRAYLLNFYTVPEARGRGLASELLQHAVNECVGRGVGVITLHASRFGRPVYERFGFTRNNEMILTPKMTPQPAPSTHNP